MNTVYLDNAATSFPKASGISDAMKRFLDESCANIGRGSYERAQQAGLAVIETREKIASLFGLDSFKHVIFTGGMTASLLGYRDAPDTVRETMPRRGVNPLDTAKYILAARSALDGGIFDY